MFQKETPKEVEEPQDKDSPTSEKERADLKKKDKPESKGEEKAEKASSKHEDGMGHPALNYDTYKRQHDGDCS